MLTLRLSSALIGLSFLALSACSDSGADKTDSDLMSAGGSLASGSGGTNSGGTNSGGTSTGGTSTCGLVGTGGATGGGVSGGSGGLGGTMGVGGAAAGTGGGGVGSGGQSSHGWHPCPLAEPCKVLPLGDSITEGMPQFNGGYRVNLFKLAIADGHDITFTGFNRPGNPPNGPDTVDGVAFPKDHAGVSGALIDAIGVQFDEALAIQQPHIVLVHAGTNDLFGSPTGASDRLSNLVDKITTAAPDALVVVCSLIPLPGNGSMAAYNQGVEPMVQSKAEAGAHVIFVDQNTDFPTSELADGVHPNENGYARMGATWYGAIQDYL